MHAWHKHEEVLFVCGRGLIVPLALAAPPAWMSKDGGKDSGGSLGTMELLQQAPSSAAKWHEDDLERVSLVPGYQEFEEKMRDKSAGEKLVDVLPRPTPPLTASTLTLLPNSSQHPSSA